MKFIRRAAAILAVFVLALLALASPATASVSQTKTVTWVTQLAPGVTTPTGANDVTWPQSLGNYAPECDAVLQIDVYRYTSVGDRAVVDALLKHGVLNKPGSAHWTDSSVIVSWKFVVLPVCNSETPTPTESISQSPTPTVTASDTPTTPPVQSSPPQVTVVQPPLTPSPSITVSSTPSPKASPVVTPKPTPSVTPPTKLPFTGLRTDLLSGSAALLILLGCTSLYLSRRKPHTSRQ